MVHFLSKEAANRTDLYLLHKSIGVIILFLVIIRIINRFTNYYPPLPDTMKRWEIILAHFNHTLVYILMLLVPLSGYLMSNAFGYPVLLFGVELPFLMQKNLELAPMIHESHWILAYILIAALVLHIAGVIKHRYFDRPEHDVLKRMI